MTRLPLTQSCRGMLENLTRLRPGTCASPVGIFSSNIQCSTVARKGCNISWTTRRAVTLQLWFTYLHGAAQQTPLADAGTLRRDQPMAVDCSRDIWIHFTVIWNFVRRDASERTEHLRLWCKENQVASPKRVHPVSELQSRRHHQGTSIRQSSSEAQVRRRKLHRGQSGREFGQAKLANMTRKPVQ